MIQSDNVSQTKCIQAIVLFMLFMLATLSCCFRVGLAVEWTAMKFFTDINGQQNPMIYQAC